MGLGELDELVEVFRPSGLAELGGRCGDLAAGVAGVYIEAAQGISPRLRCPPCFQEKIAGVRVPLGVVAVSIFS
jgi:hypothetical protein